jgi:D-alanyl-lipoteichoic acid acyltransferase DltB (MBOAT superfamily)
MLKKPGNLTDRLRAFALVCLELALVLLVVRRFDVEGHKPFFPVLCLAAGGFAVHAWLPRRFRAGFFAALSLAGILLVLGWPNGAWVIGIGGGLIALCHLPLPLGLRAALLVVAGVQLATWRVQYPSPFWPVLGSMFMFRLAIYLHDLRHEPRRPPIGHTLAYFFPLPNVCFPLFPVLDFKTFRETYYNDDDYAVYQTGVRWIVRGLSHLLLYRFIKYYVVPSPHQLRDWAHVALFLAANYALYLRVSGWFHIITGVLHLFGFNLPRTHDHYFLASSFSDIWRRINIYWKDFMAKFFFFPAFFALRRWGTALALTAAALGVFVATWLLHSYQMFWLTGDVALSAQEGVLWLAVGVLAAVNLQLDLRRARQAARAPEPPRHVWRFGSAVALSLRTVGMFALVSFFWACWTMPNFLSYLHLPREFNGGVAAGALGALAVLAAVVAAGVLAQWARDHLLRARFLPLPVSFRWSVAGHAAALALLLAAATPQVAGVFGPSAAELAATMRRDSYAPAEAEQAVRGYYEEVADIPVPAGAFLGALGNKDQPEGDHLHYTAMTRPADDFLEREPIPGWHGTLGGSPLSVNQLGMRDREGISPHKPPNTCRIALVGSSVVMGYGVRDDQVFKALLEDRLNAAAPAGGPRYELLNFGGGMWYTTHRRVLIDRKVFGFEPDALYYFAHQDEFFGPPKHLAKLVAKGDDLPYSCLRDVVRQAGITPGMSWGQIEGRLMPFGREIVLGLYRDLVAECRRRGILPVWVYIPMPGIVEVSVRTADVVSVAEEAGFTTVNLADWADDYSPADVKLSAGDHHANALGHRLLAERLFATMRARPELLPPWAPPGP